MQVLSVPADLDSLDEITSYIQEAAQNACLDKKAGYKLCLAVEEIATNIITYGYNQNALSGSLEIEVENNNQALLVFIKDDSLPYDPEAAPTPDLTLPLHERQIGGLGVFLARRNVDRLSYQRVQNRNQTTFEVRKQTQTAAMLSR